MMAQESQSGLHLPVQVSTNVLFSDRFDTRLPDSLANLRNAKRNALDGVGAGVRLLAAPTLKFNERWFAHATFQANTQPFFPYEAYHVDRPAARGRLLQAYLGYTVNSGGKTLSVKAGQMATAFGDFTRRYSDAANPLIGAPQPYGSYVLLRPDELPCANFDLQHQQQVHPNVSAYHCSPKESYRYGILPVTPYGVFGAELDVNWGRVDARVQLANSSPSNPKSIFAADQAPQWAGGWGVSLWRGLRVGMSYFRGPWLDGNARARMRPCCRWKRYCACGRGVDVQYSRGRLSVVGEWMKIHYRYPGFAHAPAVTFAYVEPKVILHPRVFAAARIGNQAHGGVAYRHDASATGTSGAPSGQGHPLIDAANDGSLANFQPNKLAAEIAVGVRPTRHTLFKVSQQWVRRSESFGPRDHVFAMQLVASLPDWWKSFDRPSQN
jgi:hypothetical protein